MNAFSDSLLRLYEPVQLMSTVDFREHSIDWLKAHVPFDSAAIASVLFEERSLRFGAGHLHRQPVDKILEYAPVAHLDVAALTLAKSPFTAVSAQLDEVIPRSAAYQPLRDYTGRFGVAQSLTYNTRRADFGELVALWRGSKRAPYMPGEQALAGAAIPHLLRAIQINLTHEMAKLGVPMEGPATVVTSRTGVMIAVTSSALEFFNAEWPGWVPPILPGSLISTVGCTGTTLYRGQRVTVKWAMSPDPFVVLHVALGAAAVAVPPLARLTAAERRVADELAMGASYKLAAQRLQISDATVRNHAHAIYSKLNLRNKSELTRMVVLGRPPE